MHFGVIKFFVQNVTLAEVHDKRILEVGSYDVNGSVRPIIEKTMYPQQYIGIDIRGGPCVDLVTSAEDLVDNFTTSCFDMVICLEVMEHVEHWREVIRAMKLVLKPAGILFLTTRSVGFPFH